MNLVALVVLPVCCLVLNGLPPGSGSMGEESFGNTPLGVENYRTWPGLDVVVNDRHRVYQQWVNGSEFFCYQGDAAALNSLLDNFGKVTADKLEVVLRPGPGVTQTFTEDKTVDYDWRVHINQGIAGHMATRDQGENIWHTWPVLTIRVSDRIDLEQLVIPDNVEVLQVDDLKQRYINCLESTDQTVRGWCCGHLAELNRYDDEILAKIAERLGDDSNWVRLNAVMVVAAFGNKAEPYVDKIRANLYSDDEQLAEQTEKTLVAIKDAAVDQARKREHEQAMALINDFCDRRRESKD